MSVQWVSLSPVPQNQLGAWRLGLRIKEEKNSFSVENSLGRSKSRAPRLSPEVRTKSSYCIKHSSLRLTKHPQSKGCYSILPHLPYREPTAKRFFLQNRRTDVSKVLRDRYEEASSRMLRPHFRAGFYTSLLCELNPNRILRLSSE